MERSLFQRRVRICRLLGEEGRSLLNEVVTVCGWSRSIRKQGGGAFCFLSLSDGSSTSSLQVIVNSSLPGYDKVLKCGTGASFKCVGKIVEGHKEGLELQCSGDDAMHEVTLLGACDAGKYPLAKKQHSLEFLRSICHLRPRTNLIGAVSRVRHNLSIATHTFFHRKGFLYVHTPVITTADCEGGGEMFQVTTLHSHETKKEPEKNGTLTDKNGALTEKNGSCIDSEKKQCVDMEEEKVCNSLDLKMNLDYKKDFFGKPAFLTVSGQLAVENFCCALSDVYTFGPTFRAENSHTSRHLAEFWMIEPEMAFADLEDNMNIAEEYLKFCVSWCLRENAGDLEFFSKQTESGLVEKLKLIVDAPFARISYTDAITVLQAADVKFEQLVEWGMDLGTEQERYLAEEHFKKPTIVFNYPKAIKAFYMRRNDDGRTVAAMDVLLPIIGEVIGGSQREERLDVLDQALEENGLETGPYWWYRELRKFGSIPHSGFGLGFERLVMLCTGVENIRDVIPFPRYPGTAEF